MLQLALLRLDDPLGPLPWYAAPAIALVVLVLASRWKRRAQRA